MSFLESNKETHICISSGYRKIHGDIETTKEANIDRQPFFELAMKQDDFQGEKQNYTNLSILIPKSEK